MKLQPSRTALTAGDDIVIVRADGVINTGDDQVTLSDGVFSGTPAEFSRALDVTVPELRR